MDSTATSLFGLERIYRLLKDEEQDDALTYLVCEARGAKEDAELELADLTARPVGLSVLRPEQANRAIEVLESKFYRDKTGNKMGMGLKVFP